MKHSRRLFVQAEIVCGVTHWIAWFNFYEVAGASKPYLMIEGEDWCIQKVWLHTILEERAGDDGRRIRSPLQPQHRFDLIEEYWK